MCERPAELAHLLYAVMKTPAASYLPEGGLPPLARFSMPDDVGSALIISRSWASNWRRAAVSPRATGAALRGRSSSTRPLSATSSQGETRLENGCFLTGVAMASLHGVRS